MKALFRLVPSLLLFLILFGISSLWAQEIKIAVLPFKINAPEDLSYVREGIQDMLSTRFYVPNEVIVIDETEVQKDLKNFSGPLNEKNLRALGKKLGVDYIVFGSLTTFGQKASLDAKLIPVNENKPPLAFYMHTENLDDLIPKLADFARQGVAYIEGKPPRRLASLPATPEAQPLNYAAPASQPFAPRTPTPSQVQKAPVTDPNKMHPERVFRTQGPPPSTAPVQTAAASPPSQPQKEVRASRYKYSDIDPWPDYPPEEEDLAPLIMEKKEPSPPKKKKKHFWSKLWPGNWFGKKEKETVITPSGSVPPPPPPPGYQAQAPTSQAPQASGSYPPPPPPPPAGYGNAGQAPAPPPPAGQTWQWY